MITQPITKYTKVAERLVFPVLDREHYSLICLNLRLKRMEYYDSVPGFVSDVTLVKWHQARKLPCKKTVISQSAQIYRRWLQDRLDTNPDAWPGGLSLDKWNETIYRPAVRTHQIHLLRSLT